MATRFLLLVLSAALVLAQTAPEPSQGVIRTGVSEVVLDVIVRNKNMSMDKKLQASDFTITEDGVPQNIKGFHLVSGRETQVISKTKDATANPGLVATPHAVQEVSFVSVVFGEMGPSSRQNATQAATAFLDRAVRGDTYAAVFGLNWRIVAKNDFTTDRAALSRAVVRAASGAAPDLTSPSLGVLNQTTYSTTGGAGGVSITPGNDISRLPDLATSGANAAPLSEAQGALAAAADKQRGLVSEVAGMAVMEALRRLIDTESKLPGRKTILYLSEGLVKPPNRPEVMQSVISAANRGNISFYCLDVRGLTAETSNGTIAGLVASAGQDQRREFDVLDQAAVSHVQLNMAELAEGTGGFATFGTNNFEKNMERVVEDVRTHYEISYVPTSGVYDGHFRKVLVTVRDPKLIVQSRDGYFALPDINGSPVFPYEADGLRALQDARKDFPFSAAALRYQPEPDGFRYDIAFDLNTSNLTARVDPATHLARLHGTFLALLKTPSGDVVNKVSQEIDREIPEAKLPQFQQGKVILALPLNVEAGRYSLDAAIVDSEGRRSSVKRLSLVVPKPGGFSLSSVVLAREIQHLQGARDLSDPLQFAGGKVLPSVTDTVAPGADTLLYFVVYPDRVAAKPKVAVTFEKDGVEISRTQPDAGATDETDAIPILTAAKLPPGDYIARVSVEQGGRVARESLLVSVPSPGTDPVRPPR